MWIFSRGWFGVGRVLAHIPCIVWIANVVPLFVNLCTHPLPSEIPYRSQIYISQGISAVVSLFLILWMPSTGLYILNCGSLKRKPYFLIPYCIIDLGLIGLMILSLVWQASYLPSTLKDCHYASTCQSVGEDKSLFCSLGQSMNRTPVGMCKELMLVWIVNICTLIFLAQSAVYPLLRVPVPWSLVWLYGHIRWNARKLFRSTPRQLREILGVREDFNSQQWRRTRTATLFDVLNEDPENRAILSLAANLHYSELVALSLTSKEMNNVMFPTKKSKSKSEMISLAACEAEKTECWCCGTEICSTCQFEKTIPEPKSSTHIYNCEPYCSKCYYKVICRRYVYGAPKPEMKYGRREIIECACRNENTAHPSPWLVCRFCSEMSQDEALTVREGREAAELKHLVKRTMRCKVCEVNLSQGGLRWWACSLCKRECVSHFHPLWEKKMQ